MKHYHSNFLFIHLQSMLFEEDNDVRKDTEKMQILYLCVTVHIVLRHL
jgi:hypothetical protein